MLPSLGLWLGALLVALTRTEANSVTQVVECGEYQMEVGKILTFKGSAEDCSWSFQAPEDGKVFATCKRLIIPYSRRCNEAALQVSSPGEDTVSFCGSKRQKTISRGTDFITFTNKPKSGGSNTFTCDVYLKMSTGVTADCSCGTENPPENRIIGGTTTGRGQYPWMGGITFRGMKKHFCALVLLTDSHALTAAHCIHSKHMKKLIAVLAEHDIRDPKDTPRTVRNIKKIAYHPQHRPHRADIGDLAVVTFDYPVPLNHRMINPVCLPPANASDYAGREAITAGWGSIDSYAVNYARELQAVSVPIWNNSDCRKTGFGNIIHEDLLCAGLPEGGKDACIGDSGGPLTVEEGNKHVLVGEVSFGHRCALPNWPGVYSRISGSLSWIKQEIRSGNQCQN